MTPADSFYGPPTAYPVAITNTASMPLTPRSLPEQGYDKTARMFTAPARSTATIRLTGLDRADDIESLTFAVLNAYIAPEEPLTFDLTLDR